MDKRSQSVQGLLRATETRAEEHQTWAAGEVGQPRNNNCSSPQIMKGGLEADPSNKKRLTQTHIGNSLYNAFINFFSISLKEKNLPENNSIFNLCILLINELRLSSLIRFKKKSNEKYSYP